jgi:ComF family protein
MLDTLLSFVAPHICCGCGKTGSLLCVYCKDDIMSVSFVQCIACRRPTMRPGVCRECRLPYQAVWCVGERSGPLLNLIDQYKFTNAQAACRPLGELLDARLPQFSGPTVIVPVPTVASHIRQRGYDHILLIARYIARQRHLTLGRYLDRVTTTTQRGASRAQRIAQAQTEFVCTRPLEAETTYVIIDDVVTTDATIRYAARALRQAGARSVVVAVIARQPLD